VNPNNPPVKLDIVVPCYNEQDVLPETSRQLGALLAAMVSMHKVAPESRILFVDDGSRDDTWSQIRTEACKNPRVSGLRLSRNRGHQNAVLAGLTSADGDVVVTVDADLQDDITVIEAMVDEYYRGCDVVYGVRDGRSTDSVFKRTTAVCFYRMLSFFGVELVHNHADFRLMSRRAVAALRQYRETNLYLRGIVPLIGFRSSSIAYARKERFAGKSKYPLRKMLALALEAITSFSVVPLQIISMLGFTVFAGSMAASVWVLWIALFTERAVPGWASTVLPIMFLGGLQLLCLGIIGAYLGKVYGEIKARPRFFVDDTVNCLAARPTTDDALDR